ncbi:MAG: nucleotide exchange factor GrpE [Proteobacteria bacterium]|nr:nucleotide exchange factor GrpE [Pseudomonadota bacterium]MBU1060797.1 nucleotide exchange factor GrpE [Pseudomonadota bacterium]
MRKKSGKDCKEQGADILTDKIFPLEQSNKGEGVSEERKQEEILEEEALLQEEGLSGAEESVPERDLEKELANAKAEIGEKKDQMLRLAAEFENYKKRMIRERATAMKYAGESILREILPVVDNLERAVSEGEKEGVDAEKGLAALLEGVQLTLKSLLTTLEKFEVKPVESVGKPFDPNIQEALTMEASDTLPANHVLNEFEKGYQYKDRLLRAAKVIVSAGEQTAS